MYTIEKSRYISEIHSLKQQLVDTTPNFDHIKKENKTLRAKNEAQSKRVEQLIAENATLRNIIEKHKEREASSADHSEETCSEKVDKVDQDSSSCSKIQPTKEE